MEPYERFTRVLNFETPDRVVSWSNPFTDIRLYRDLGGSGSPEEIIPKAHRRLGIDATRDGSLDFPVWDKRIWSSNMFGYLRCEKSFKYESVPGIWTTWIVDTPYKKLEDLADIELHVTPKDQIIENCAISCTKRIKAFGANGIVYVPTFGSLTNDTFRLLGWQLFARAQYQARQQLGKIMDKLAAAELAEAQGFIEGGADPAIMYGDDLANKTNLMFSPQFLREEWTPRVKKIIDLAHSQGVKVLLHSHGAIHIFTDDIVKMGFDGLHPIEPTAGMSLSWMKNKYGDKLVLLGNVDSCQLLTQGSPEMVEKEAANCIRDAAPGSGYCLCSSGPLTNVPTANAIAMYGTVRKYGTYPNLAVQ